MRLVTGHGLEQIVPARGRVADAKALGDGAGETAALEVVDRVAGFGVAAQLPLVPLAALVQQRVQWFAALALLLAVAGILTGHFQAGSAGQVLHSGGKVEPVVLHEKADGIAAGATAEAVEKLFVGIDRERRGLLFVERTQALVIAPGTLEFNTRIDGFNDIDPIQ